MDGHLTSTSPSKLSQRLMLALFVVFALVMGLYGLGAIDSAYSNYAAVNDPSVLDRRIEAQQRVLSGEGGGVEFEYIRETGVILPLISKIAGAHQATYGHDGLYETLIYYSQMPQSNIAVLSLHNLLGGLCMLFGALQFWPAFRQRHPRWHRGFGLFYMTTAQAAMIAAMAYMVMTPLERMYDTLTFTTGLWFLAIGVTLTLWMSIWHLLRKEYAQHQAYMALNYAFLLTAPFTRINWGWAVALYPELPQSTSNYLATAILIPGCVLIGYALLCMNRWLQKERTAPNPQPGIAPKLQARLQPLLTGVATGLAALGVVTLIWNGLLHAGLTSSPLVQRLVPASVIAHDVQVLGEGLTMSRAIHALSTIAALVCAVALIRRVFGKAAGQPSGARSWATALALLTMVSGSIMLMWGWQVGAPSKATLAGGVSFMFNGLCCLTFGLLLLTAIANDDDALIKEYGVFTYLSTLAFPAFYWALGVLSWFPIDPVYIDAGHVYRLSMYVGPLVLVAGVVYSAYGEATLRRFAR